MKTIISIARILLGLIFTLFGLNGFLHFLPLSMPTGLAAQFIGALFQSNYMTVVFLFELAGGVLLLSNRYVALAVAMLAPILVNILLFHITMEPAGLPLALVVAILWIILAGSVRSAFAGLFQQRIGTSASAVSHR